MFGSPSRGREDSSNNETILPVIFYGSREGRPTRLPACARVDYPV